jgi:hypothetical protein
METNGGTMDLGAINIAYECEKCGAQNNFQINLRTYYSNMRGNRIGPGVLLESKYAAEKDLWVRRDYLLNSNEGILRACPKCGHVQSWMSEAQIKQKAELIFWGLFFLPFMLCSLYLRFSSSTEGLASIVCASMPYLIILFLLNQQVKNLVKNYLRKHKKENSFIERLPVKEWTLEKK